MHYRLDKKSCGRILAFLGLLSLAFASSSHAQSDVFAKWVTSPYGSLLTMVADSQRNTYVTGSVCAGPGGSCSDIEAVTIKVNPQGQTVWRFFLSSPLQDAKGVDVAVDAAGNVYTLYESQTGNGPTFGEQIFEIATAKYSPTGTREWINFIPSSSSVFLTPSHLAVTPEGDVYITYTAAQAASGSSSAVVLKYDTNGKELWSKTAAPVPNLVNSPTAVGLDSNENAYVLVNSSTASHTEESVIVKFDPAGDVLASFGQNVLGDIPVLHIDPQGNSYVSGSGGTANDVPIAAKFTSSGATAWVHNLSKALQPVELPVGITTDSAGQIFIAQTSPDAAGNNGFDIAVLSLDANGNERWLGLYAHPNRSGQDMAAAVAVNSAGDAYVTGYAVRPSGITDAATVKFESTGKLAWAELYAPSGDTGAGEAIAAAGPNVFVLAGVSNPSSGAGGTSVIDYVQDAAEVSLTSLTFGSQAEKTESVPQFFTLTNTADVEMTQISFDIAGDFQLINNCPTSLAAGTSCKVGVTFTPTATGTSTGTVFVHDDWAGSTTNPQTVKLTGTGTT
jgi:hypothetical protein